MDPWAVAQAQVAAKYDPQQAAIDRQLQSAKSGTAANEAALGSFGEQGRGIIGSTYGTLYGLLDQNRAQQKVDLGQQAELGDRAYDQALSQMGSQQQASRDYLSDLYKSLGQENVQMPKFSESEDIAQTLNSRAQFAKTAYGGNYRDWASKMDAISGEGINSAHQTEALKRSEFEAQLIRMIGENKLSGTEQEAELTGKLADMLGMRGNDLIAMYNELAQQEWERSFAQAQLDQEANIASANRASSERIASMQESGANSRASAANKQASDLEMQKFLYGISKDEQDRLDALNQAGFGNQIERDKLGLERQKMNQGQPTDWGALTGNLLTAWPLAFIDPKTGAFDSDKYFKMATGGAYSSGNPNEGGGNIVQQVIAQGTTNQNKQKGQTVYEEVKAKNEKNRNNRNIGSYFNFGSLLGH